MTIVFADTVFELEKFSQYEDIRYSKDMSCSCGYSNYVSGTYVMIGYCDTRYGFMAVFECPRCGEKYRHHIGSNSRYSESGFKGDAGLGLYLQAGRKNNCEI